jgi:hypothetical protein
MGPDNPLVAGGCVGYPLVAGGCVDYPFVAGGCVDYPFVAGGCVESLWSPVRENLLVERESGLRRQQTKLSLQRLAAHLKLAYRLVAGSHLRIEHYESTMDVLPGGVVPKHLA